MDTFVPHDFIIKRKNEIANVVKIIKTLLPPGKELSALDSLEIVALLKGKFDDIATDVQLITDAVESLAAGGLEGNVDTHYHESDRDLRNSTNEIPIGNLPPAIQSHVGDTAGNPHGTTLAQLGSLDCENQKLTSVGDATEDGDAVNAKMLRDTAVLKDGIQTINDQKTFTLFPEVSGTDSPPTARSLVTRDFVDGIASNINDIITDLGATTTGNVTSHYHASDRDLRNANPSYPLAITLHAPEVRGHLAALGSNPHGTNMAQLSSLDAGGRQIINAGAPSDDGDVVTLGSLTSHAVTIQDNQSIAGQKTFSAFPRVAGTAAPSNPRDLVTKDHVDAVQTSLDAAIAALGGSSGSGDVSVSTHHHDSDRDLANATGTLLLTKHAPEVQQHLSVNPSVPGNPHGTTIAQLTSLNCENKKITGIGDATSATDVINLRSLEAKSVLLSGDQTIAGAKTFSAFPIVGGLGQPASPRQVVTLDYITDLEARVTALIGSGPPSAGSPTKVSPSIAGHFVSFSNTVGDQADSGRGAADFSLVSHNHAGVYEPANGNIQTHVSATGNPHAVKMSELGDFDANSNKIINITNPTEIGDAVNLGYLNIALGSVGGGGASTAAQVTFTPVGNVLSTNVQAAIAELDGEKSATNHAHAGVYEPVFAKNTAFNKNFGVNAQTIAEGNHSHTALDIGAIPAGGAPAKVAPSVAGNFVAFSDANGNQSDSGKNATYFSASTHNHTGTYEPANGNIQSHIGSSDNPHAVKMSQLGDFDANSNKIINIADPSQGGDAVNLSYLNTAISTIGGGGTLSGDIDESLHYHSDDRKLANATGTLDLTKHATEVQGHLSNTSNPHGTNAAQVGAPAKVTSSIAGNFVSFSDTTGGQVDSGKNASNFAISSHNHTGIYEPANGNIQSHVGATGNPHGTTAGDVGAIPVGGAPAKVASSVVGNFVAFSDANGSQADSGKKATDFAITTHNHTGVYEPADGSLQLHLVNTSNPHTVKMSQLADLNANNRKITNLINPTQNQDAVTLGYMNSYLNQIMSPLSGDTGSDLSSVRSIGVVYQNNADLPVSIFVTIYQITAGTVCLFVEEDVNPPTSKVAESSAQGGYTHQISFLIPPGHYYSVSEDTSGIIRHWYEVTHTGNVVGGGGGGVTDLSTAIGTLPLSQTDMNCAALKLINVGNAENDGDAVNLSTLESRLSSFSPNNNASQIAFTPTGSIAATNVQAAIAEIDNEKAPNGHDHDSEYETKQLTDRVLLNAEFPASVFTPLDAVNTLGIMTTGFDLATKNNYYKWTTDEVITQSYGLAIKVGIPNTMTVWTNVTIKIKLTGSASVELQLYDGTGAQVLATQKVMAAEADWAEIILDPTELAAMNAATWTGNDFTITIKFNASSNGVAQVSSIVADYLR